MHSGVALRLQWDLDKAHDWAVDANGFYLEQRAAGANISSNGAAGSPVLARPFFNVNAGVEDADPLAVPGVQSGRLGISLPSRLFGADSNLRYNYLGGRDDGYRITILAGVRYLRLDEKLVIAESLQDLPGVGAQGNTTSLGENFTDYNTFLGGQIGLEYEWRLGPVFMIVGGKCAFGNTHELQRNTAFTQITEPNGTVTQNNDRGLLVQPSNAFRISKDTFAYVPEGTFNLGVEFNKNLRASLGYNVLAISHVMRPGYQVDRAVNIQALQPFDEIGIARPALQFNQNAFWVMGLTANVEFSF
jgi:hypothetical protein